MKRISWMDRFWAAELRRALERGVSFYRKRGQTKTPEEAYAVLIRGGYVHIERRRGQVPRVVWLLPNPKW